MRIVQTFWSGASDPLKNCFGWTHPEYNLMSWALSCLSIRENHQEVALYTDPQGYEILIKRLQLPYTEVHIDYNEDLCLSHHWAYAKVMTYSKQVVPFLHVDGDVYFPKPFPMEVADSSLVVQNREVGTGYYKTMMDNILSYPDIILPEYVKQGMRENTLSSYNMGVFGGKDLGFIHHYCNEVFSFMKDNHMNESSYKHSVVWCNILFEQIFLAALADKAGIKVHCLGKPTKEEGYTLDKFCNLSRYEEKAFFHLVGGHKRCSVNYEMLYNTLIRLYPEYLTRVLSLFPNRHIRMYKEEKLHRIRLTVQMSIAQYEDFINRKENEWYYIPNDKILDMERQASQFVYFERSREEKQKDFLLQANPMIEVFHIPSEWHPKAINLMKQELECEAGYPLEYIVAIPTIARNGVKQVPIVGYQKKMLDRIKKSNGMRWGDLEENLLKNMSQTKQSSKTAVHQLLKRDVMFLLRKGILIIKK